MAIPQCQQELLHALRTTYTKLATDLTTVPHKRARELALEGHAKGTLMSVADLVAYLIGWNALVLKWCERDAQGKPVDFPETGFKWNELGALAQKFYADYASLAFDELLQKFADIHYRIVALVESSSDETLYGAKWYRTYTKGRMIQFNTASPYANACTRLRKWLRSQQAH